MSKLKSIFNLIPLYYVLYYMLNVHRCHELIHEHFLRGRGTVVPLTMCPLRSKISIHPIWKINSRVPKSSESLNSLQNQHKVQYLILVSLAKKSQMSSSKSSQSSKLDLGTMHPGAKCFQQADPGNKKTSYLFLK